MRLVQPENKEKLVVVKQLAEELGLLHDLHVFETEVNSNYQEQKEAVEEALRSKERILFNNIHQATSEVFGKDVFQSSETG